MAMTGGTSKLLKTTYPFSDSSKAVKLYAYYKHSQDVTDNESTVTCGMYVTTPSGWDIGTWNDFNGSYVGKKTATFDGTIPNFSGTRWLAENKKFTVAHNSDGTGSATIYWKWGVNSPWGGFVNPSGSFNITLPTIARASVPTLSATSVKMGGTVTITTNRKSSSFTHDLTYTFGGTTKTIKTGVGASYTWTVPDLASLCNNATSGTCTITCKTKNGSTVIGAKTVTLTLTVPSATTPTLSATSVQMGKTVAISVSGAASSNFTHTIQYSFGGASGTIATGLKGSKDWTPPKSLAAYTSNKTSVTCTITCVTYNGTAKVGTTTKTLTLTVPSRTIPILSATTVAMDTDLTITLPREADVYVHDLTYSIKAEGSSTVAASGTIATNQGTSYKWKVPLDLAKKIPSAVKGTITITCSTHFNGSTTAVGSYSVSFTATVPNNSTTQPTLEMDLSVVSSLPSAFSGLYIQGKTKVKADFTAKSTYSTIKSYSMTVDGNTKSGDPCTSEFIQGSGSVQVKGRVTDAREYYKEVTEEITVIPYGAPKVIPYTGKTKVICERSLRDGTKSDEGEYLHILVGRSYSPVISEGSQKNFCALQYRYKVADAEFEEGGWSPLIARSNGSDNTEFISDFVIDTKTEYTVQIMAVDDIGEYDTQTFPIASIDTPLHLGRGGKNLGLGQYCNYSDQERIDIGWTTHFNTGIAGRIIFANVEGWSEGTELGAIIPDSDLTAVNEYNIFLAIADNSIPIICTMLGEYIYGGITTEAGSYAIKMEYIKTENEDASLTLLTAKNITQSQTIKLTALYALL